MFASRVIRLIVVAGLSLGCGAGSIEGASDSSSADEIRKACPADENPCTLETRVSGRCVSRPAADGTACPGGACQAGSCVASTEADTVPPELTIAAPSNGAIVSGVVSVAGTASDAAGIARVEVQLDSGVFEAAVGTSAWSHAIDTRLLADGAHAMTVRAADKNGLTASASVELTVANASREECLRAGALVQQGKSLPSSQTGAFEIAWDVTPLVADPGAAVGLAQTLQASMFGNLAIAIRFVSGRIDALDGTAFAAAAPLAYAAGSTYRVRAVVSVPARRYSAFVTAPGGAEVAIARDFAFRAELASLSSLELWAVSSQYGEMEACLVSLEPLGAPALSANPTSLDFGEVRLGQSTAKSLQIVNSGSQDATLSAPAVLGRGFSASGLTAGTVLRPGQSASVSVAFAPAATGPVSGSLSIATTAADSSLVVQLNGSGAAELPAGITPAFPGAQGGGAASRGGRGACANGACTGRVIFVDNLADSGTGSLRACLTASGPRTCVFRVAGVIRLTSSVYISNGELTVAGQTAPGDGIAVYTGGGANVKIAVEAPDVVFRYVRFWGDVNPNDNASAAGRGIALAAYGGAVRYVVDHCTLLWQTAYTFTMNGAMDQTYSWNLMGENLMKNLSDGQAVQTLMVDSACVYDPGAGGLAAPFTRPVTDIDLHHNLFASASHRIPGMSIARGRFVNNAVYNFGRASYVDAGGSAAGSKVVAQVDFVGNHYKPGPYDQSLITTEIMANRSDNGGGTPYVNLFVSGNRSDWTRGTRGAVAASADDSTQWRMLVSGSSAYQGESTWYPLRGFGGAGGYARAPWARLPPPASGIDVSAESADSLQASLVAPGGVGASRRLDCRGTWVTGRDNAEQRIIGDYVNGTGPSLPPASAAAANGGALPVLASGAACADGDADGMPDLWEGAQGLNPSDAADGRRLAAGGYTNLEHYLNGTDPTP